LTSSRSENFVLNLYRLEKHLHWNIMPRESFFQLFGLWILRKSLVQSFVFGGHMLDSHLPVFVCFGAQSLRKNMDVAGNGVENLQKIPIIIQHKDGRHLNKRHWGLVPFWAKDTSIGSRMINARAETVG
jgi:hypothetical protein